MANTILICGGRTYENRVAAYLWFDKLSRCWGTPGLVIHGDQAGGDHLGRDWARAFGIEERGYPIKPGDMQISGNRAGNRRNQRMLDSEKIDCVWALPGGSGTADMIARALDANIRVYQFPSLHKIIRRT